MSEAQEEELLACVDWDMKDQFMLEGLWRFYGFMVILTWKSVLLLFVVCCYFIFVAFVM